MKSLIRSASNETSRPALSLSKQRALVRRSAMMVALLLTGATIVPVGAAPHTWINFRRGQPTPPNLTITQSTILNGAADPAFAVQLVPNTPGVVGRAIITRPANVPAHNFKFFGASFAAMMLEGTGADGFSFNYGPNENVYNNTFYEDGTSQGLAISFDCRRDANRYPDQCNIYYNGALVGSYGLDLWDGTFSNQYLIMQISYTASGLSVKVLTVHWFTGAVLVDDTVASNLVIPNWDPRADWKFFYAARNGGAY